ncbi:DUF481 domain-containing protein [Aureibaculum sp. A20]|uniref:DUF481 domain-containing protein n=1 Tax=Aureibaculum flavum TaxID=2795986 RepID=A0ABS0WUY8_9FLAO|nr:DUF481 domain-containing protein [Aureibaculum flavum]MBJ2175797.1 DUF481 domain-containing protein [Aureibaculum flavum]
MKYLVVMLFLTFSLSLLSQNKIESFHFKSVAISPGLFLGQNTGGFSLGAETGFAYKNNLFTISATLGGELNVLGGDSESFSAVSLLYGRSLLLNKNLTLDTFLGAGYFSYKYNSDYDNPGYERSNTVGFPVSIRLRYQLSDNFSLGIKGEEYFNSLKLLFNTGIVVQWNFKKRKR